MKSYISLTLVAVVFSQPLTALATVGDALKNSVNEETVNAVKDASVDVRKEAVIVVLNQAETILTQVETEVQNSVYASSETKADAQVLIDDAQTELADLQTQAEAVETVEDLTAIRQAALTWLQDNKDLAKEITVDVYIDSLNASIAAEIEVLAGAKALIPYFYKLDTTTYKSLIDTADASLAAAQTATDKAAGSRTQADLDAATRAVVQASKDVAAVVAAAEDLYNQMAE